MDKKPNNKTQKAFALSAIVGAMLMASNNGDFKLSNLKVQIDKAMKVFSVKAPILYYKISDDVQKVWVEMAKEFNNTLDEDEITVFIEMVLNLMPKQDMKTFLNMPVYKTVEKLRDEKKSQLLMAVMELDKKLNKMFGTNATVTRESLALVMVKPIKQKTVKKERDKAKPYVLKKIRNRARYARAKVRNNV